ncbi:MAG: chlorophyll synthesis pathway protein BchC [Burkholderiales bacterium]|nr:chlorophyll synthesis pathway protein BchC [Burkholderiales bacterium]
MLNAGALQSDTTVLHAKAVVLDGPAALGLQDVILDAPGSDDVVVEVDWSGISTGTERLLYDGSMPPFPGMGYPLIPGYESVGRVIAAGRNVNIREGETVFVPGARCFGAIRGLFGGAAQTLVTPVNRVAKVPAALGADAVLLALAATARHALANRAAPQLIVGHGVLGRLLARITIAMGQAAPLVWESNPARQHGATGYNVCAPQDDARRDYRSIVDASGADDVLNLLISRLAPGGEVVLAGFYHQPLKFDFAPAFMREARLAVSAEWKPADLIAVQALISEGALSLDGLVTHRQPARDAAAAYRQAFTDPGCLKMVLDWREMQ